ncbi:MAG TPA: heavy metal-binding domain-containing protein [Myxococcota bacterium]|jgi:uncharacterized protein YbjQ (UPF0145 family)
MEQLVVTAFLLVLGFVSGKTIEHFHYQDLAKRERRQRRLPALTTTRIPADWRVEDAMLLTGTVVVSLDYWKRFAAGIRQIFGGNVRSFESLFERARREALLRLKEAAAAKGCDIVIGVRLESAELANQGANGKGTAGVELIAIGTGLRARR